MGSPTVPSKLWVKYHSNRTKAPTDGCTDVDDFINAILDSEKVVRQLQLPKDGKLTLHTNENEDALKPLGRPLSDIPDLDKNDEDHPLIVKVAEPAPVSTGKRRRLDEPEPDPTQWQLDELLKPFPTPPSSLEALKGHLREPLLRALPISEQVIVDSRVELGHGTLALDIAYAIRQTGMSGTSEDMRHLWIDVLIRQMFEDARDNGIIPEVELDRNTKDRTAATAKSMRPDWMVWLKGNLLFKGEEKAEQKDFGDAINELTSKFGRMPSIFYGDVSFMICYAAAGPLLAFYAIERRTKALHDISRVYRLTNPLDRLSVLCVVFNILRILRTWYPVLGRPSFALGEKVPHGDSTITFFEDFVLKTVPPTKLFRHDEESVAHRIQSLCYMYAFARDKPGLVQGEVTYRNGGSYQVRMSTIGIPLSKRKQSMMEADVRNAAKAVLQGLDCLHSASIVHRDIRLDNVLYLPEAFRGHNYALIDFEHAGGAGDHWVGNWLLDWTEGTLSTEGCYTTTSDTYQCGVLIEKFSEVLSSPESQDFIAYLKGKPTAKEALKHPWITQD
ncbi:hypothetical protein HK102_004077 [Quaeritorhiza haematococci]|nr:hypothetical protein HK102_004077 [Quaeritorhiza haematococci]